MTPSSMGYFYSPALAGKIRDALSSRRFDLVFVYCSSVAQYVENVRGVPRVIDFVDMDSQKWLVYAKAHRFPLSLGYWLEGIKLARAEARIAGSFVHAAYHDPSARDARRRIAAFFDTHLQE